jgi:hypothetical protein
MADAQHGVVALWQMRDAGFTRGEVDSRLALARLHIVHRGVYAVGHANLDREGWWMAAVLALGPTSVLSHRSAAAHWGLVQPWGGPAHVSLPKAGGHRRRDGIIVHRVPAVESTVHEGIPVTTVPWTLLDLAACLDRRPLERAIERAVELRVFDLAAIERVIATSRPGCRALMDAIAAYDEAPTRQELERLFLKLCADHGLPRPVVNTYVGDMEVDFTWPAYRVAVETDSRTHHATPYAFERDRRRDAALTLAGWRIARFTWRQVVDEPQVVASVVRALLAGASVHLERSAA